MYTVDMNKALGAARLALGALRQYAPDDTLLSINEIISTLGIAQITHGRNVTPEGRGHTDITAREDLQAALALAYAALHIDTTAEAPF